MEELNAEENLNDEEATPIHDPYGDPTGTGSLLQRRFSRLRFTSELLSDQNRSQDNLNAMADSYRNLLVNIGENPDREGLLQSQPLSHPHRGDGERLFGALPSSSRLCWLGIYLGS